MSHIVRGKVAKMTNLATLEGALTRLGVKSFVRNGSIKMYYNTTPVDLGVKAGQMGNRYDFGYRQLPDGTLEFIHESMESHTVIQKLEQNLLQQYVALETEETLGQMGFSLETHQQNTQELALTFSRWR